MDRVDSLKTPGWGNSLPHLKVSGWVGPAHAAGMGLNMATRRLVATELKDRHHGGSKSQRGVLVARQTLWQDRFNHLQFDTHSAADHDTFTSEAANRAVS